MISKEQSQDKNTDDHAQQEKESLLALIEERFDVEALAQIIEHDDSQKRIDAKLNMLNQQGSKNAFALSFIQNELRDIIMDVALLKRALTSMGQIGVIERKRIEKELILELFPPNQVRPGLGIVVAQNQPAYIIDEDCEKRIHLCKQACCRIFDVHLNADEVESGKYDWNPRSPYSLHKNHKGCVHLIQGKCIIYQNRPATCCTYSCRKDSRIWADYENMVLNPVLKQRLTLAGLLAVDKAVISEQSQGSFSNMDSKQVCPSEKILPPDFSKLQEITVAEPMDKFVPSPQTEICTDSAT